MVLAFAHAVFVGEAAFQHIADDFHIAVPMRTESLAGRDAIVIDDAQRAEAHMGGIVITGEGKSMPGVEPAVVGMASVFRFTDRDHD